MIVKTLKKLFEKNRSRLLHAVEKDEVHVRKIPFRYKLLFLATNLPYWLIALTFLYKHLFTQLDKDIGDLNSELPMICTWNFYLDFVILFLAFASTTMHTCQMRVLPLDKNCCSKHHLTVLKEMDLGCCAAAFVHGAICCGLYTSITYAAPGSIFFFISAIARVRDDFESYMLFHGLWHIASAISIYHLMSIVV